jgi:glucose-1-phosphate adenylyltransferase
MNSSPASLTRSCLAFILAGGRGSRLHELTDRDCKPAIPFAGSSRIVDFVLANTLNSGIRRAVVATQYEPKRLVNHIRNRWEPRFATREGSVVCVGSGHDNDLAGYKGTADAVFQNIDRIDGFAPRHVLVLAADHVYQMDYGAMLEQHVNTGAAITIAADIVPRRDATGFGVIKAEKNGQITGFQEKPANPAGLPEDPERALASMGIYVFDWPRLKAVLQADARDPRSSHDFGKDILPKLAAEGAAYVHRLSAPIAGAKAYWRDVGTVDALHEAHMDLLEDPTCLNLEDWPLHVGWIGSVNEVAGNGRSCLIYPGSEAIAAHLDGSAIGPLVTLSQGAKVERSVLMTGVSLGSNVRLRDAVVAPGTRIDGPFAAGFDPVEDQVWFRRTARGILLIDQAMVDRMQVSRRVIRGWTRANSKGVPATPPASFVQRQSELLTLGKNR